MNDFDRAMLVALEIQTDRACCVAAVRLTKDEIRPSGGEEYRMVVCKSELWHE